MSFLPTFPPQITRKASDPLPEPMPDSKRSRYDTDDAADAAAAAFMARMGNNDSRWSLAAPTRAQIRPIQPSSVSSNKAARVTAAASLFGPPPRMNPETIEIAPSTSQSLRQKLKVPQTPKPQRTPSRHLKDAFEAATDSINARFFNGSSSYQFLGNGDYCKAYQVSDLVYKVFFPNAHLKSDHALLDALSLMFREYTQLKNLEFPIVKIHTFDLLSEQNNQSLDLTTYAGCKSLLNSFSETRTLIADFVPNEFPKKQNALPIDEIELSYYKQAQNMFHVLYQKNLPADLSRDNLRIDTNGKVIYVDPLAIEEDDFACLLNKLLETFADPGTEVYQFLDPRESSSSSST